jgi:ABC-type antimicrobial peptide transport system permease subunit
VYRVVGGDYFEALGMKILEGRALSASDDAGAPRAVVVDETFAKEEWPGQSAIGRRVRPVGMDAEGEPWFTVVGVVSSARAEAVTAPYRETYYFDHRQRPTHRSQAVTYVVRSSLAPSATTAMLRREIRAVDPQVPIEEGSMARIVDGAVADRRFMMLLLAAFAGTALMLALVGVYAVVSYRVAQRTQEIAVRLALGATAGQVIGLIMRSSMRGVIPGLVAGGLLAFVGVRALRSLLYGVSPQDPVALLSAVALLGAVGLVSTLLPARRATRVDPLVAMRAD